MAWKFGVRARALGAAVLFGSMALAGCASTPDNLQRETARSLGTPTSDVTISNVDRGMMSVSWRATTPSGEFECSADDMVRRVHCTPLQ